MLSHRSNGLSVWKMIGIPASSRNCFGRLAAILVPRPAAAMIATFIKKVKVMSNQGQERAAILLSLVTRHLSRLQVAVMGSLSVIRTGAGALRESRWRRVVPLVRC